MCGVIVAAQVGKAAVALPALESDFRLTLVGAAAVLSMIKLVGAAGGAVAGGLTSRLEPRRVAIYSLVVVAAASLAGAGVHDSRWLLATRVAEGAGTLGVFVSVPSLLLGHTNFRHHNTVFGLWGAHVSIGMALSLVTSPPVLDRWGWRALWAVNGAALVCVALALALATRDERLCHPRATLRLGHALRDVRRVIRAPAVRHVSLCFFCYTAQWAAVVGFLPTIYAGQDYSTKAAGFLTAVVVAVNAIGNIAAGTVLRFDVASWKVLAAASATMGVCSIGIFASSAGFWTSYALTVIFSLIGGLLPATILASVPGVAGSWADVPTVNGLLAQGSSLGGFTGPLAIGALVAFFGNWSYAPVILLGLAAAGVGASLALRRDQRSLEELIEQALDVAR